MRDEMTRAPRERSTSTALAATPQVVRRRFGLKDELLLATLPTLTMLGVLGLVQALTRQRLLFASLAGNAFLIYLDPRHATNGVHTLVTAHLGGRADVDDEGGDSVAPDTIRLTLTVPLPAARAFARFGDELAVWWPRAYTWSGDVLADLKMEPRVGGHCFERGPEGFTCDWGRVLVWAPPHRLAFTWQISPKREPQPDPAKASEVELRFRPDGPTRTHIQLVHRHLARHGVGWGEYHAALRSDVGWPFILACFAAASADDQRGH